MEHIVSNNTGLIHLIFSFAAVISGTCVLAMKKGNRMHKKIGYIYSISMIVLLFTSFLLYNLYGRFAIFHWFAVISTLTLMGGMIPMLIKRPKSYISFHFNFMYWSVFGLYAAFMAEVLVRIPKIITVEGEPNATFFNAVGIAIFITMGFGYTFLNKKKKLWIAFDTQVKTEGKNEKI